MLYTRFLFLSIISTIVLAGCGGPSPTEAVTASGPRPPANAAPTQSANSLNPPAFAPEAEPGTASISGVIYSYTISRILPETLLYLTPAIGDQADTVPPLIIGPEEDSGDIITTSNVKGEVLLDDIPPGSYYMIVWAPLNWSIVEASDEDPSPRLIRLEAGEQIPLGVLFVSWP